MSEEERAEPLELGAFVRSDPELAVRRELRAAIGDLSIVIADRCHPPAGDVDQIEVRFVDRDILDDHTATAIGREVGQRPAATLHLRQHPVGRGVAGVDQVEIVVGAVAPGRAVGKPAPVMAPGVHGVAALAIGQHDQPAVLETVELPEFASPDILLDDLHIARLARIARGSDPVGFERGLPAGRHRGGDLVDLGCIAEPGGDHDPARARVPAFKAGSAEFHIGARRICQGGGNFGYAVGDEGGWLLYLRQGRCGKGECGQEPETKAHVVPFCLMPFASIRRGAGKPPQHSTTLTARPPREVSL